MTYPPFVFLLRKTAGQACGLCGKFLKGKGMDYAMHIM
jgi:hypothetical protein